VIPVYNEVQTIGRILNAVALALPEIPKQIVIVDDRSSDGTSDWLRKNLGQSEGSWRRLSLNTRGELELFADGPPDHAKISFSVLFHERNRGKGAAVRTGLTRVSGDVVVIQDADLEYDPNDWSRMLPLIVERKVADVVYGSRFYGRPHRSLYFHHYLGNRLISFLFNLIYNQMLSDVEVCYKMFTQEVARDLRLTSDGFGIEIEITAQIARAAVANLRGGDQLLRPHIRGGKEDQLDRRPQGVGLSFQVPDTAQMNHCAICPAGANEAALGCYRCSGRFASSSATKPSPGARRAIASQVAYCRPRRSHPRRPSAPWATCLQFFAPEGDRGAFDNVAPRAYRLSGLH
jgi:Glycosyl transferase family 2